MKLPGGDCHQCLATKAPYTSLARGRKEINEQWTRNFQHDSAQTGAQSQTLAMPYKKTLRRRQDFSHCQRFHAGTRKTFWGPGPFLPAYKLQGSQVLNPQLPSTQPSTVPLPASPSSQEALARSRAQNETSPPFVLCRPSPHVRFAHFTQQPRAEPYGSGVGNNAKAH